MLNNTNTTKKTNTNKTTNNTTSTTVNNSNILSFDSILQQQTSTSVTSNYTNYNSKKQLVISTQFTQLSTNVQQFIQQLKNCFCFSLHNSLQYIVITMYFNATKTYSFYVVNCTNNTVQTFNSIKSAKQYVNSNVNVQQ
jgi:hypothetical protein